MNKEAGTFTIHRDDDGSQKAFISLHALALMATRVRNGRLEFFQEASWTHTESDKDAHKEGLVQAQQKWPVNEGWEHHVAVRKVTLHMDLIEGEK